MDAVLSAGLAGVQAGQRSALEAAQKISSATITQPPQPSASAANTAPASDGLDALTEGAVELLASEQQVNASASVIKSADEALGTLIDTSA